MSKIVGEVVAANEAYVRGFGKKGDLPLPPGSALRDPDLHGRPARPGQIRGPCRGRRACHPQRGRPRDRRRDPVARHFPQAPRDAGMVCHPPHELRHGALHRRGRSPICSRTISPPRASTARPGRTRITTAATPPATSSNGIRSRTSPTASHRTCVAFASIRWCLQMSRLRLCRTTSGPEGSTK